MAEVGCLLSVGLGGKGREEMGDAGVNSLLLVNSQ